MTISRFLAPPGKKIRKWFASVKAWRSRTVRCGVSRDALSPLPYTGPSSAPSELHETFLNTQSCTAAILYDPVLDSGAPARFLGLRSKYNFNFECLEDEEWL